MTRTLHVWPYQTERSDGQLKIGAQLELPSGARHELWYRVRKDAAHMVTEVHDYLAVGTIFLGMSCAEKIEIHGVVSRSLLANLAEFIQAWHCWRPEKYRIPDLIADEARDWRIQQEREAICAISGGVDSVCTLYRHAKGIVGARTRPIAGGVMVHGFDIPHLDLESFSRAFARSRTITASVGVELFPVRTNYRDIPQLNWEDTFLAATISSLLVFSKSTGAVLVGSGDPYQSLVYPWGSNPITDHLLGSREVDVITDGLELRRIDKVKQLLGWPEAVDGLRVCWEGADPGRNCGVCEKCMRTRLEFHCLGIERPACFDTGVLTPADVMRIRARNQTQLSSLQEVLDEARSLGREKEDWCRALKNVVTGGVGGREGKVSKAVKGIRSRIALRTRLRRLLAGSPK